MSSKQKYPQVVVFGLTSGAHVIAQSVGEIEEAILVDYPLEIIYEDAGPESMVMSLIRYLPFSEKNQTLIQKHSIETMTLCSERFNELYAIKKASFEAYSTPIDDSDTTIVTDRSDSENEDSESDGDDEDGFLPATPMRRTYH